MGSEEGDIFLQVARCALNMQELQSADLRNVATVPQDFLPSPVPQTSSRLTPAEKGTRVQGVPGSGKLLALPQTTCRQFPLADNPYSAGNRLAGACSLTRPSEGIPG